MQYLRARYYDPATARFSSSDSYQGSLIDPSSLHKYAYANADPISYLDPSGHLTTTEKLMVAAVMGAGFGVIANGLNNVSHGDNFFDNWHKAAAFGAVLGPLSATFPFLAVTLAGIGLSQSLNNAMEVVGDPKATLTQKGAAIALVGLNVFGAGAAVKYAASTNSLWINTRAFASSGPTWASEFQGHVREVNARVAELRAAMPTKTQGWVVMAYGIARDASGNLVRIISTSEDNGYLRPGVDKAVAPGDVIATGTSRHAEINIINYARANNLEIITIGATRPVCSPCAAAMGARGIPAATPLKNPAMTDVFPSLEGPQ
jgi:hypothetical protein